MVLASREGMWVASSLWPRIFLWLWLKVRVMPPWVDAEWWSRAVLWLAMVLHPVFQWPRRTQHRPSQAGPTECAVVCSSQNFTPIKTTQLQLESYLKRETGHSLWVEKQQTQYDTYTAHSISNVSNHWGMSFSLPTCGLRCLKSSCSPPRCYCLTV